MATITSRDYDEIAAATPLVRRHAHTGDNRRVEKRVFRPGAGRWFGYAWLVFAGLNLADLAWRGSSRTAWVIGAVLLLATAVVCATALRPRIVADEDGLRIVNPLRTVVVPWGAVVDVDAKDTVRVHAAAERPYRCWAVQVSNRQRRRARPGRRPAGTSTGAAGRRSSGVSPEIAEERTHAEYVAAELSDMARRARRDTTSGGTEVVTWSRWSLAALGAGAVVVLAAMLVPWP